MPSDRDVLRAAVRFVDDPTTHHLHELRQLVDSLVPIKVCANEACCREFRFQEGRAEQGQLRATGVRYCSKRCAKAQIERDRRARLRGTTP